MSAVSQHDRRASATVCARRCCSPGCASLGLRSRGCSPRSGADHARARRAGSVRLHAPGPPVRRSARETRCLICSDTGVLSRVGARAAGDRVLTCAAACGARRRARVRCSRRSAPSCSSRCSPTSTRRSAPMYITSASWPSGHATAIVALVWCALFVAPPARRRIVAIVGAVLVLRGRLLAADLGVAHAERRARRLSARHDVGRARARGAAPGWPARADRRRPQPSAGSTGSASCAPGAHSASALSFAARLRMNSMSESRLR